MNQPREIKFRIWDGTEFYFASTSDLLHGYPLTEASCFSGNLKFQEFVGLLDKNSKEIYEGDIIFVDELLWEVTFRLGAFMVIPIEDEKKQGDYGLLYEYYKDCSVEGNIFENKQP